MFKRLILQRLNNLSDERLQYQVSDRLSFMRFLGLELAGNLPDARTVWAFREALKGQQRVDALFERLNQVLAGLGVELIASRQRLPPESGQITGWPRAIDARRDRLSVRFKHPHTRRQAPRTRRSEYVWTTRNYSI